MSETKHTPGPWKVLSEEAIRIKSQDGSLLAMLHHLRGVHGVNGRIPIEEVHANARLIAAAPELLEALKELLGLAERHGWLHVAVNNARAAIAKAEGEEQS